MIRNKVSLPADIYVNFLQKLFHVGQVKFKYQLTIESGIVNFCKPRISANASIRLRMCTIGTFVFLYYLGTSSS